MARKKHQPSPSSSSEDDSPPVPPSQISKKQPPPSSAAASPKPPKQPQPPPSSSSEEDSDTDSESESDSPPPAKSPATAMVTAPPPPSKAPPPATSSEDEEDEEEEEEDDDDSSSEPDEPEKPPKPPSPKPVEPQKPQKTPEKKRKAPDTASGKDLQAREEPNSKRVIERLWSGADEILLLKGMIEFHTRHGHEPTSLNDAAVLLEIISKQLHAEFTPSQLLSKFRNIKRKYAAHLMKERAEGEMSIQKSHEREVYNLSKQVWGNMDVKRRQSVENGKKTAGCGKATGVAGASPMKRIKGNTNDGSVVTATLPVAEGEVGLNLTANTSLILEEMRRTGASSEKIDMLKEHLRIVKPDIIAGLAESWRELRGEEVRLWNKQTELVADVLKAALSGMHK